MNNHVRLIVHYHEDPASFVGSRIVGFEVEPVRFCAVVCSLMSLHSSVHHKVMGEYNDKQPEDTKLETCTSGATPLAQRESPVQSIFSCFLQLPSRKHRPSAANNKKIRAIKLSGRTILPGKPLRSNGLLAGTSICRRYYCSSSLASLTTLLRWIPKFTGFLFSTLL